MMQGTAADTGAGDDYQIEKSLKFVKGDAAYLSQTPGVGNRTTWTWSGWVKWDGEVSTQSNQYGGKMLFATYDGQPAWISFNEDTPYLQFSYHDGSSYRHNRSSAIYRDPSTWMHVVVGVDTTLADSSSRLRMYVNGKRITSFSTSYTIPQYTQFAFNNTYPHHIGASSNSTGGSAGDYFGGYLADVQFIDGFSLSPAAFGSFDSTGVFNAKALSIPAPNTNKTWSGMLTSQTGTFENSGSAANLFDSNPTTTGVDDTNQGKWLKFTPTGGIAFSTGIRVYNNGQVQNWEVKLTDGTIKETRTDSAAYHTLYEGSGTLEYIKGTAASGAYNNWFSVEVDGVSLVDGQTDETVRANIWPKHNDGTTWINNADVTFSGNGYGSYPPVNAFDGNLSTFMNNSAGGQTMTWNCTTAFNKFSNKKLRLYCSGSDYNIHVNGTDTGTNGPASASWVDLGTFASITELKFDTGTGNAGFNLYGVEIDGCLLINGASDQSFHLKFNDTTSNTALGYDSLGADFTESHVEKGGPILKTNKVGTAVTSGNNTDANSSNLVFAWPGVNLTADVSASNHTVTNNSVGSTTGATPKFYSACGDFGNQGQQQYISVAESNDFDFGTGSWTIETWIHRTSDTANSANLMGVWQFQGDGAGDNNEEWLALLWSDQTKKYTFYYGQDGAGNGNHTNVVLPDLDSTDTKINTWHHFAVSFKHDDTSNGTLRLFINGKLVALVSDSTTNSSSGTKQNGWGGSNKDLHLGIQEWGRNFAGYLQDFRIYKGVSKYNESFKLPTRRDFTVNNLVGSGLEDVTGSFVLFNNSAANLTDDKVDNVTVTNNSSVTTASAPANPHGVSTMASFSGSNYLSTNFANPVGNGSAATLDVWWDHNEANSQSSDSSRALLANGNGGYIQINGNNNGGQTNVYLYGTTSVDLGAYEWGHFRVTWDGTNTKAYWNGVEKYSGTATCSADNIMIGANGAGGEKWEGRVGPVIFTEGNLGPPPAGGLFTVNGEFTVTDSETISLPDVEKHKRDSSVDTPNNYLPTDGNDALGGVSRGNYATLNPLAKHSNCQMNESNIAVVNSSGNNNRGGSSTFGMSKGKWYFEVTTLDATHVQQFGVSVDGKFFDASYFEYSGWCFSCNGYAFGDGNAGIDLGSWGNTAAGDVYGIALDVDAGKMWISKNGTWNNVGGSAAGNPATGANPVYTSVTPTSSTSVSDQGHSLVPGYSVRVGSGITGKGLYFNFGAQPFTTEAPTDFKCLCTQNIPDTFSSGVGDEVNDPSKYFGIKKYYGNDSTQTIKGLKFQPDLVWLLPRDYGVSRTIWDAVRGTTKAVYGDQNNANTTIADGLTAFNSDGFTLSGNAETNKVDKNWISWNWDAGTSAATASTDGSITPSAQWVNATAGFSISKFTGTGAVATVGHGLGVPPAFVAIKNLTSAEEWVVGHIGMGDNSSHLAFEKYIHLDNDQAMADHNSLWHDTNPTNTVVTIGTAGSTNASTDMLMYAWAPIPGFSAFGFYEGNASNNGTFVHLGFRPALVIVKNMDAAAHWNALDFVRETYNMMTAGLYTSHTSTETDGGYDKYKTDHLANGFRHKGDDALRNAANTYLYCAWAEHPFKTARAK